MKNHFVKLTSNDDKTWGDPIYVSALAVQGITIGDPIYASDKDPKARRTSGTGEHPIGNSTHVHFANQYEDVREPVGQVAMLFEEKLREISAR